jgi:NDP-sugar pyrophosphorylase family protein
MRKMIVVILAAGKGTRMHPFSTFFPKPALPICNKPLIQHSIEMFRELGIREVIVVIGHLGHELTQALGDGSALGVRIRYVEQTRLLGIAAAVGQLEPYVDSPMFLLLGDIFFKAHDLGRMVDMLEGKSAVLAVKRERDPEAIRRNFTVAGDPDGRVRRVVEKPRHVATDVKGCGLYLFDLPVFDAVRRTPRTAMRDEYEITDTIQIMIDDGLPVYSSEVVDWDINLTTPADVLACNLFELGERGLTSLVGAGARIHPGARLHNVVVGERAVIEHPIEVRDSVIFANTVVSSSQDVVSAILTPELRIDCGAQAATVED